MLIRLLHGSKWAASRSAQAIAITLAVGCSGTDTVVPVAAEATPVPAALEGRPAVRRTETIVPTAAAYEVVTVPAGTRIVASLEGALASDVSRVGDPVRAVVRPAVPLGERVAIPRGSVLRGRVVDASPSGRIKGRARLAFRFDGLDADDEVYAIRTAPFVYEAPGTKVQDAKTIGIGAGAGAAIGAIAGGKKGAAIGSAIGGGSGAAVVLSSPGEQVEIASGTDLTVELIDSLQVRLFDDTRR